MAVAAMAVVIIVESVALATTPASHAAAHHDSTGGGSPTSAHHTGSTTGATPRQSANVTMTTATTVPGIPLQIGDTIVDVKGSGSGNSGVFVIPAEGGNIDSGGRVNGSFSTTTDTEFWVIPAGRPFVPDSTPSYSSAAGISGGLSVAVDGPGSYYLEVRAGPGPWSFSLDVL